ncbi:baseplate J/gp47 family protein [Streptomyces yunnanensis]|uniref:baseplate J/gp47 family protein n=1 Tax=Streptomyces yunnanensis TaxID=156453 RepID=UPI0011614842|nr:baseplate J/gp47 family protein [Streptomyces yunnanensis]
MVFTTSRDAVLRSCTFLGCGLYEAAQREGAVFSGELVPFGAGQVLGPGRVALFVLSAPVPSTRLTVEVELAAPASVPVEGVVWEAWRGTRWERCEVEDGTGGFVRSGAVTVTVPAVHGAAAVRLDTDPAEGMLRELRAADVGLVRCSFEGVQEGRVAVAGAVLGSGVSVLVPVVQAQVVEGEELGVSSGLPGQRFVLARRPLPDAGPMVAESVVGGERLEWVRVESLAGSGPGDRHFVVDPVLGEVVFGPRVKEAAGVRQRGAVPVEGAVLRMVRYLTGGGVRGNVAARSITVLRTPVPLVAGVSNPEPTTGGTQEESLAACVGRVPLTDAAGPGRAVTAAEYEERTLVAPDGVVRAHFVDPRRGALRTPFRETRTWTPAEAELTFTGVPEGGVPRGTVAATKADDGAADPHGPWDQKDPGGPWGVRFVTLRQVVPERTAAGFAAGARDGTGWGAWRSGVVAGAADRLLVAVPPLCARRAPVVRLHSPAAGGAAAAGPGMGLVEVSVWGADGRWEVAGTVKVRRAGAGWEVALYRAERWAQVVVVGGPPVLDPPVPGLPDHAAAWVRIRSAPAIGGAGTPQPTADAAESLVAPGMRVVVADSLCTVPARQVRYIPAGTSIEPASDGAPDMVRRLPAPGFPITGGKPSIRVTPAGGTVQEWTVVDTFAASGPADRHVMINASSGEIRFGSGEFGAIPETDASLAVGVSDSALPDGTSGYLASVGQAGNVAAGTITTLISSGLDGVEVTNERSGRGGADGSTEVTSPSGGVGLLAVPAVAADARGHLPYRALLPSLECRRAVARALLPGTPPAVPVEVAAPGYRGIAVDAWLVGQMRMLPSQRERLQEQAQAALYAYFNPLTGGPEGNGWPLGRPVHAGDAYGVLCALEGVAQVTSVQLYPADPVTGRRGAPVQRIDLTDLSTLYSTEHHVEVSDPLDPYPGASQPNP